MAGAEIIDLTEPDSAEAAAVLNPQQLLSPSQSQPQNVPVAGPSRLPQTHDVKKSNTRDNPIVISDEEFASTALNDEQEHARRRNKRHRSADVLELVKVAADKHASSQLFSTDNRSTEADTKKRRKNIPMNECTALDSTTSTPDTPKLERRKRLKQARREEKQAIRDAEANVDAQRTAMDLAEVASSQLFVLDYGQPQSEEPTLGTSIPDKPQAIIEESEELVLPSHVSIAEGTVGEVKIQEQTLTADDSEDDDFIKFLDYDDVQRGVTRYFADTENKHSTYACKRCGAEGEHKTIDCPVVICLTCGARNNHVTRSCPISKTCFNCGIKGHINSDCPNRFNSHRVRNSDRMHDCDRCGSSLHTAKECPTLWRMYDYVTDEHRDKIMWARREKESLEIGEGGEGYIGEDLWCYNCGDDGHLGDDCTLAARPPEFPREPSAFGRFNILSGPFADLVAPSSSRSRRQREWEVDGYFDDGYGFSGPSNVGKRGRDKEKERMRQRAQEVNEDDDGDDWFGNRGRQRKNESRHPPPLGPKRSSKDESRGTRLQKPSIKVSLREDSKKHAGKRPNLSERLEMAKSDGGTPYKNQNGHSESRKERRDREREKERHRDRDRDRERHSGRSGGHDSSSSRKYYGSYRS